MPKQKEPAMNRVSACMETEFDPESGEYLPICPTCAEFWRPGDLECSACGCTANEGLLSEDDEALFS